MSSGRKEVCVCGISREDSAKYKLPQYRNCFTCSGCSGVFHYACVGYEVDEYADKCPKCLHRPNIPLDDSLVYANQSALELAPVLSFPENIEYNLGHQLEEQNEQTHSRSGRALKKKQVLSVADDSAQVEVSVHELSKPMAFAATSVDAKKESKVTTSRSKKESRMSIFGCLFPLYVDSGRERARTALQRILEATGVQCTGFGENMKNDVKWATNPRFPETDIPLKGNTKADIAAHAQKLASAIEHQMYTHLQGTKYTEFARSLMGYQKDPRNTLLCERIYLGQKSPEEVALSRDEDLMPAEDANAKQLAEIELLKDRVKVEGVEFNLQHVDRGGATNIDSVININDNLIKNEEELGFDSSLFNKSDHDGTEPTFDSAQFTKEEQPVRPAVVTLAKNRKRIIEEDDIDLGIDDEPKKVKKDVVPIKKDVQPVKKEPVVPKKEVLEPLQSIKLAQAENRFSLGAPKELYYGPFSFGPSEAQCRVQQVGGPALLRLFPDGLPVKGAGLLKMAKAGPFITSLRTQGAQRVLCTFLIELQGDGANTITNQLQGGANVIVCDYEKYGLNLYLVSGDETAFLDEYTCSYVLNCARPTPQLLARRYADAGYPSFANPGFTVKVWGICVIHRNFFKDYVMNMVDIPVAAPVAQSVLDACSRERANALKKDIQFNDVLVETDFNVPIARTTTNTNTNTTNPIVSSEDALNLANIINSIPLNQGLPAVNTNTRFPSTTSSSGSSGRYTGVYQGYDDDDDSVDGDSTDTAALLESIFGTNANVSTKSTVTTSSSSSNAMIDENIFKNTTPIPSLSEMMGSVPMFNSHIPPPPPSSSSQLQQHMIPPPPPPSTFTPLPPQNFGFDAYNNSNRNNMSYNMNNRPPHQQQHQQHQQQRSRPFNQSTHNNNTSNGNSNGNQRYRPFNQHNS